MPPVDAVRVDPDTPPPGRRRLRDRMATWPAVTWALGVAAAVFLLVRLGPSLVGQRVFLGMGLLDSYPPWSGGAGRSPATSVYVQDQIDFFTPGLFELHDRLWGAGDLVGWSSYVSGGSSLLGTPIYGLVSAGRWLYLLLPTDLAPAWSKLLELAFAATFTYLLVRRLHGSRTSAAVAGFVYPTTGFMIAWTNWPQVAVGAAIPMLFWAVERFLQERRLVTAVPVSLAVALLLFGGFPAVAGQTLYVGGLYAVARVVLAYRSTLRDAAERIGALVVAVVLGLGLTAVQTLPFVAQFLETVDLSYRDQGFYRNEPFRYLLTTLFPGSFAGNRLSTYSGAFNPVETATYVGSVVAVLVILGVLQAIRERRTRSAELYLAAVIVVVVVLIWLPGPWTAWLSGLPIFSGNPIGRWRSQLGVPVAVLAALGYQQVSALARGKDRRPVAVSAAVLVVVGGLGLLVGSGAVHGLSAATGSDVAWTLGPLVLVVLALAAATAVPRLRPVAPVVIVLSIAAQALAATGFYWPTSDPDRFYPTTAAHEFLMGNHGADRVATTAGAAFLPDTTTVYGIRLLNGHAFTPKKLRDLLTEIDPGAFSIPTYSVFDRDLSTTVDSPGLDRLDARYLVATGTSPLLGTTDALPAATGTLALDAGRSVTTTIAGGPLRGVTIPLAEPPSRQTTVRVVLTTPDGTTVADNTVVVRRGSTSAVVPLAAEDAPTGDLQVEVTAASPGLSATAANQAVRLAAVRPPTERDGVRIVYAGQGVTIYERAGAVPRIHWAGTATVIKDADARKTAVASDPVVAGQVILSAGSTADLEGATARLRILEDSGDTIRVRVASAGPGYLVVTDNVQDDFAATVDGRSVPIVEADYAGGAVLVGEGTHEVELTYHPRGRAAGTPITVGSAVALALVVLLPGWARRRTRRR